MSGRLGRVIEETARTTTPKHERGGDAGDTLVEVLLALLILALASVALIIAFSTTISASARHRQLTTSNIVLDSVSQEASSQFQGQSGYFSCPNTLAYPTSTDLVPSQYQSDYTATVSQVWYWNGTNFAAANPCVTNGPLQITVSVVPSAGGVAFTNTFVVDSPLGGSGSVTSTGTPIQLVFLQEPVNGSSGAALPAFTVAIEDKNQIPVSTDFSPITLVAYQDGNPITMTGCLGVVNQGVVTFTGCTVVTQSSDPIYLDATDGISTVNDGQSTTFTVTPATYHLVFTTPPAGGKSGMSLGTQPVVTVENSLNVAVSGWSGTIMLSASGGTLANCSQVNNSGVVTFTGCTFAGSYIYNQQSGNGLAATYAMTASTSDSLSAVSVLSVTGPGTPTQLQFSVQPTGVASSNPATAFTQQPQVTEEDSFGNIVYTDNSTSISLAISAGETLTCTGGTSLKVTLGTAAFKGCQGTAYLTGITMTATSGSLTPATSDAFSITGAATKLVFTTQPLAGGSGLPFTREPIVEVEDASSNVVTSWQEAITLTSSGGILSNCSNLTPDNGYIDVASCDFSGLVGTNYTLTAADSSNPATLTPATSAPFSPTTFGVATQVVFTTSPTAGLSGSAFAVQPVVKVEDAGGNVVTTSSATISLASEEGASAAGLLANCNNLSAVSGVVNVTGCSFAGLIGTNYQLLAQSDGLTSATSGNFSPTGPGPAAVLVAISGSGQSATVPAAFASPLVVAAKDTGGNLVPNTTVTFTPPVSGATVTISGGDTAVTGANGQATSGTLTSNTVAGAGYFIAASSTGTNTVNFTETNLAQTTNDTMTIIQGNGQSATVGSAFTNAPEVQIVDQYDNAVSGMAVTFSAPASGASATFTSGGNCTSNPHAYSCVVSTNSGGYATTSTMSAGHAVGGYSVTTSASGVASPVTFSETNTVGQPAEVAITPTPSTNAVSGTTNFSLNVQLEDQYGNPTSSTNPVTITLSSSSAKGFFSLNNGTAGTLGGTVALTIPAGGTGTATAYYGDEGSGTPTITGKNGATTWGTTTVTLTAGPATTIAVTSGAGQSATVGANFTNKLVATVTDQFGNPVSGVTVTFTPPGTGASATIAGGNTAVTGANGQATSGTLTANTIAGAGYLVSASATGTNTVNFTETNTAKTTNDTMSIVQGSNQSAVVGIGFPIAPEVQIVDQYGNPVSGVAVTFSGPASGASEAFASGGNCTSNPRTYSCVATTNAAGDATTSVMTAGHTAGTYSVTTSAAGVAAPSTFTETNTAGTATTIVVTSGSSQSATVGAAFTNPLVATVTDTYGNPVSGVTVTFTPPGSGASATIAGGNTAVTGANGQATSGTLTANTVAGAGYLISASAPGTNTVNFTETNTAKTTNDTMSIVQGNSQSAKVGVAFSTAPEVQIVDQYGNPVSGVAVTFSGPASGASVAFAVGGNCTSNPQAYSCVATTNAAGDATTSVMTAGHTAGAYSVTTSAAGVAAPSTFSETNTAGTATTIAVTSGSGQSATVGAAFTSPLVATVTDTYGNPVSGVTVTFTPPGSGASGAFTTSNTAVTGANGQATSNTFTANHTAGTYNVSATAPGTNTANFSETNTAGTATTIAVTSGSGQSATVGVAFTNKLVATVTDQYNNAVSGVTVTFTPPGSGASATIGGGNTAVTAANGQATSGTLTANTVAGAGYLISASAPGTNTVNFTETNTSGAAKTVTVTSGSGQSATVGAAFTNKLVATVTDQYGNPVSGVTVTFAPPGSGASATISGGNTAVTGANGQATSGAVTANTVAAAYVIGASAPGTNTASFSETNTPGTATKVSITPSPSTVSVSGTTNVALTVQLQDQYGNPTTSASTTTIALTTSSTKGFFNAASGGTGTLGGTINVVIAANGTGAGTTYYGDETAGTPTITGKNGSNTWGTTTVTTTAGAATTIAVTSGSGQSATVGAAFTNKLVATVTDQYNNPVSGVTVTFAPPGSGATLSIAGGNTAVTAANGQATSGTLTASHTPGTYNVGASAPGTNSVNFSETNTVGAATKVAITAAPASATVSGTTNVTLTVQLQDQYGNNTTSASATTIALSTSSAGGFFNANSGGTGSLGGTINVVIAANGTGSATTYYGDETSGSPTITGKNGGVTWGTTTVTYNAGTATGVSITPVPASASVGTTTDVALTVQLKDQYGNNTTSASATTIALTTSSTKGFFNAASGGSGTLGGTINVVIAANGSGAGTTYYGDETAGSPTITGKNGANTWGTTNVTMTAGLAMNITVTSGSGQSSTVGTAFTNPLVATVTDVFGNPVSGATVTFTPPVSADTVIISGGDTAVTGGNGQATSGTLTASHFSGAYSISASATGTNTVNFSETNKAGTATQIGVTANPTSELNGTAANIALTVQLEDQYGNATSSTTATSVTMVSTHPGTTFFTLISGGSGSPGSLPISIAANGTGEVTVYFGDSKSGNKTESDVISTTNTGSLTNGTVTVTG